MKCKVVQLKRIIRGSLEKTYIFDANSLEEAEQKVSDGDAEEHCFDIDWQADDTEEIEIESEEV